MIDRTFHKLIDTVNEDDLRNRAECAELDHPPVTYNPHMKVTFCRCGGARYPGDRAVKHTIVCVLAKPAVRSRYGPPREATPGLCAHDCERAIAYGLPRDYDRAAELPGQTDLLAMLEEVSR